MAGGGGAEAIRARSVAGGRLLRKRKRSQHPITKRRSPGAEVDGNMGPGQPARRGRNKGHDAGQHDPW